MSVHEKLLWAVQPKIDIVDDKISIIGSGMVGMAVAVSILAQGATKNLVLVDAFGDKVKGEVMDLQHGSLYLRYPRISGGNDFSLTANSKLCIITAGVRQNPGESRLALAQRNADIMIKMVPELIRHSPETMILMVGNPCDVLTWVAWRVSGLPAHKVMGAGTTLDSARFRSGLAKKFNISPSSVHGYIIGEHGDNSIALWSGVNIGGVKLQSINPKAGEDDDPENWKQLHRDVINAAGDIINLKGYTNWGIGMSVAKMAKAICGNIHTVFPVSVNVKGKYGIADDVFVPVPAVVGCNGITDIVNLHLAPNELQALQETVKLLKAIQDGIVLSKKEIKCKCKRCAQ